MAERSEVTSDAPSWRGIPLTPAAERALVEARAWRIITGENELDFPHVLLGLLSEGESLAARSLLGAGVQPVVVQSRFRLERNPSPGDVPWGQGLLRAVKLLAARPFGQGATVIATEHLLLAALDDPESVGPWLREQGLDREAIEGQLDRWRAVSTGWYQMAPEPAVDESRSRNEAPHAAPVEKDSFTPSNRERSLSPSFGERETWRLIDAAANRAREGIRVVEDYVRFARNDESLLLACKRFRHDLSQWASRLDGKALLACRDTTGDVGTSHTSERERTRTSLEGVVAANMKRAQEALRSLEEFGKLVDPEWAAGAKSLRYRCYTLEAAIGHSLFSGRRAEQAPIPSASRLSQTKLCVLAPALASELDFAWFVEALTQSGVGMIQLREKAADQGLLLRRAKILRELTRDTSTLCAINDHADVATLAEADALHLGQTDLPFAAARTIVPSSMFVGVSTHDVPQFMNAIETGADYLGVGPVFSSSTKRFDSLAGLAFVKRVAAIEAPPWFAIGGITLDNLDSVMQAGAKRVAVSNAIVNASDPAQAALRFLERLS